MMKTVSFARALVASVLLICVSSVSAATREELLAYRHPEFGRSCGQILLQRTPQQQRDVQCVSVFFGTSRAIPATIARTTDFGVAESSTLRLGRADVWLPRVADASAPRPRNRGEVEVAPGDLSGRPLRQSFYVYVTRISAEGETSFYAEMERALAARAGQSALLFIHGYNVTFDEAVIRTAQLSVDLQRGDFDPGVPIAFSWPSAGETADYWGDARRSAAAADKLDEFLDGLVAHNPNLQVVNIVAHSMGNRVLAQALRQYSARSGRRPVEFRIVSAAGDINREAFIARADRFEHLTPRPEVTVYGSQNDLALGASQYLAVTDDDFARPGLRVGQVRNHEPFLRRGYVSVDASSVASPFDGYGHGYYSDNPTILFDIGCALAGVTPERRALTAGGPAARRYWVANRNVNPPETFCQLQRTQFPAAAPAQCPSVSTVVYFEYDRSNLNAAALGAIDAASQVASQCLVRQVVLEGHADTSGAVAYNAALSERRASAVRDALTARGFEATSLQTEARGETDLARATRDGVREPLNRRVAITIEFE